MTSSSRILKGDQLSEDFVSWSAPVVDEAAASQPAAAKPAADDPALILEQARQQGFEQGIAEGFAAGKTELAQQAQLLHQVLQSASQPLQSLDQQFEEELLTLVGAVARQLVRREFHLDPSHVISVIREGLAALPAGAVGIRVRLHPQDADTVRELLPPDDGGRAWAIEPDPLLEQGGCQIVSETSQIDGRLETRLARVIATMLEDERAAGD